MSIYLQALLGGIATGAVYGLIALGLSLQFGVMKIINFAHGSFLMVAMYVTYYTCTNFGLHPLAAAPIAAVVLFFVGWACQRFFIDGIYRKESAREPIGVLIFTTGLWIFLDYFALALLGPDSRMIDSPWSNEVVIMGDLIFTYPQIAGFVIAALVTIGLVAFMRYTALGRAIRATGQDREAASVLGIDSKRVYQLSFAIGLGVLGIAGALLLPMYPVNPFVGDIFGMRAFVIVVLGGIGSIAGAFWGGIIVGILESVGSQVIPVTYAEALIFLLFLGVMYFRPSGLFGVEKE